MYRLATFLDDKMTESTTFLEPLPVSCPPEDALDQPLVKVWRFVDAARKCVADLVPTDFSSHAALNLPVGNATECESRSCSLWVDARVKKASKMPKLKSMNMAQMDIPEGNGRWVENTGRGHVHFWVYRGRDMVGFVTQVVAKHA